METLVKMEKPGSPDSQTQTTASVTPFSITDILTRMESRSPTDLHRSTPPDHRAALADLRHSPSLQGFRPVSVLKYSASSPMDLSKDSVIHPEVSSSVEPSPGGGGGSTASSLSRGAAEADDARDGIISSPEGFSRLLQGAGGGRRSRSASPCSEMSMEEVDMDNSDREDTSLSADLSTSAGQDAASSEDKGTPWLQLHGSRFCPGCVFFLSLTEVGSFT